MQILSVVLYHASGETRKWDFRPGTVNIITGARRTGKTALLRIIEYCMGRRECDIPENVIRNSVAWYAVLFQIGKTQVFVARRNPPPEANTSSDIHLEAGSNLSIPLIADLKKNCDIDGLVVTLGDLLGIGENLNIPEEGRTRDPLEANLRHTWFYLFQRQDEITAPSFLFHRENENSFMQQAVKDSLPYFLGVVKEDRFAKQEELRRLRREVRRIERRIVETEWIKGEALSWGKSLLAEAQELGIYPNTEIPEAQSALFDALNIVLAWKTESIADTPGLALDRLQDERADMLSRYRQVNEELDAAVDFSDSQNRYVAETTDQRARLESVGLLKRDAENFHCPLCDSELSNALPLTSDLTRSLDEIQIQLEAVSREKVRMEKTISERREELGALRQKIRDKTAQIIAALEQNALSVERRRLENRRVTVVGRISLYVDSVQRQKGEESLSQLLEEYKERLESLEEELSEGDFEIELNFVISAISKRMSSWTANLDLEYARDPVRFDFDGLTVVADTTRGPVKMSRMESIKSIKMSRMGGGTNALSCHLLALFGLHSWFVSNQRPVPAFLMIDQISQVYYPAEPDIDPPTDPSEDERVLVRQMYRWLFDRVAEMGGNFQLIITDHANLKEDWFQDAVVDSWRQGKKMVPDHWIPKHDI